LVHILTILTIATKRLGLGSLLRIHMVTTERQVFDWRFLDCRIGSNFVKVAGQVEWLSIFREKRNEHALILFHDEWLFRLKLNRLTCFQQV
jgi:hypothetical protein